MAGSENKTKADSLTETVEALRAEINELKNRPGDADILANLRADLQTVKDELAAAKAKPDATPKAPDNGTEKPAAPAPIGDKPRERFGFW